MRDLIDLLVRDGWTRFAVYRYAELFPGVWASVASLPLVEAADSLEVYAAYENIPCL